MATPPACSEVKLFELSLLHQEASRSLFWSPPQRSSRRSHVGSPRTLSWECPSGLSRISLQVYRSSPPPPGPRSPRPSSHPRCPRVSSAHSPALPHDGSGLAQSCWTSVEIASRRPGLSPFQGLPHRAPSDCREKKLIRVCIVHSPSGSPSLMHLERSPAAPK